MNRKTESRVRGIGQMGSIKEDRVDLDKKAIDKQRLDMRQVAKQIPPESAQADTAAGAEVLRQGRYNLPDKTWLPSLSLSGASPGQQRG